MNWIIPGTTLTAQREDISSLQSQFEAMFLCGGMTLRQITDVTGLDPYLIQNWATTPGVSLSGCNSLIWPNSSLN